MLIGLHGRVGRPTAKHGHECQDTGITHALGGQEPPGQRGRAHKTQQAQQAEDAEGLEAGRQERRREHDDG